jgi:hypothetical protein
MRKQDCRLKNRDLRPTDSGGELFRQPRQVKPEGGWCRIPSQRVPSSSPMLVPQPALPVTLVPSSAGRGECGGARRSLARIETHLPGFDRLYPAGFGTIAGARNSTPSFTPSHLAAGKGSMTGFGTLRYSTYNPAPYASLTFLYLGGINAQSCSKHPST